LGLDHASSLLRPRPDLEAPLKTSEKPGSDAGGMGLFGDAGVPVVLVGTSFSLRGNFNGALQQAMQCRVLDSAQDGGGLLQSPTAYLTDEAFKQSKPKLLIWEIPERFLTLPLTRESTWLHETGLAPLNHALPRTPG
jgi:alginate O-acetyltransferase complex protein AlgJ